MSTPTLTLPCCVCDGRPRSGRGPERGLRVEGDRVECKRELPADPAKGDRDAWLATRTGPGRGRCIERAGTSGIDETGLRPGHAAAAAMRLRPGVPLGELAGQLGHCVDVGATYVGRSWGDDVAANRLIDATEATTWDLIVDPSAHSPTWAPARGEAEQLWPRAAALGAADVIQNLRILLHARGRRRARARPGRWFDRAAGNWRTPAAMRGSGCR